ADAAGASADHRHLAGAASLGGTAVGACPAVWGDGPRVDIVRDLIAQVLPDVLRQGLGAAVAALAGGEAARADAAGTRVGRHVRLDLSLVRERPQGLRGRLIPAGLAVERAGRADLEHDLGADLRAANAGRFERRAGLDPG